MPVVAAWDFANRRVYMGAPEWHPIDLYREYREKRRTDEDARKYDGLMRMEGNIPKGGGRFTERYLVMLLGAKIVPMEGDVAPHQRITGEIITDDETPFVDTDVLDVKPFVAFQPPAAEIIVVNGNGDADGFTQADRDVLTETQSDAALAVVAATSADTNAQTAATAASAAESAGQEASANAQAAAAAANDASTQAQTAAANSDAARVAAEQGTVEAEAAKEHASRIAQLYGLVQGVPVEIAADGIEAGAIKQTITKIGEKTIVELAP